MHITPDTLVADIVSAEPTTIKVFQRHDIDFCCGGRRPLGLVCAERHILYEPLVSEIAAALESPARPVEDWTTRPLAELIAHILETYHEPLREELPRLAQMAAKVVRVHGEHHPTMLPAVAAVFGELKAELESHMMKEEAVLFPAITALERAVQHDPSANVMADALGGPIAVMEDEHARAGDALVALRGLTDGYRPPEGACHTFIGLFHGLAALERALHLHIHLENNVLFARAARLGVGM